MSVSFPSLAFKCPGLHWGPESTTYNYKPIADQGALDSALSDGWFYTLGDAIDAHKKLKIGLQVPASAREFLELKAKELGIKFDGRNSDDRLKAMIEEAMTAKGSK